MTLADYFEHAKGVGVLSTADQDGRVNAAIYGRPHVIDEKTIAFIASDRLTHANLKTNPSAVYLFKENGSYEGKRLYLMMIREEKDSPLIEVLRRKKRKEYESADKKESKFLVYFKVKKVLPLIGSSK